MSFALSVRNFFSELLQSKFTKQLEQDLLRLREDFTARLQEKDQIIAELRTEKAALYNKTTLYEMTLLPHASRAGADVVNHQRPTKPNFGAAFEAPPTMSRWQQVQKDHEAKVAAELAEEEKTKEKSKE